MAAALLVVACGGEGARQTTAEPAQGPASEDASRATSLVTITGRVKRVLHDQLFSIDGERGREIVVMAEAPTPAVAVGAHVRVAGQIVPLDVEELADRVGLHLTPERTAGLAGAPCFEASTIDLVEGPGRAR